MKRIGLTGGLASGKSTASRFLAAKGAYVIDADKLGHRVYEPGTQGYLRVIETFGEDVVGDDNHIDRRALGGKVFGNPAELRKLTDIVWPEIKRLADMEMSSYEVLDPDGIVVLEAAVLLEASWEDIVHELWVVVVERETAITRAMKRDGATREQVEGRLNAQLSNEERIARADQVLANNGSEAEFNAALEVLWSARE